MLKPGCVLMQPEAQGEAAAGASGANGTAEPSTSSSFIPGSVLRLHFAGEGALPDYSAVKEALGGREAGVRFVETSDEVRALPLCAEGESCYTMRAVLTSMQMSGYA